MQYIYGTTDITQSEESVVVLGNFDGVHRGHQQLFEIGRQSGQKKGLKTIVFSFHPHPTWIIGKHAKPLIMSRRDKKDIVSELKMDLLIEYPFTKEFAAISPEQFFVEIIINKLKAKVLVIGSNYYFGKGKQGDSDYMCKLGEHYNVDVRVVDTIKMDGKMISSSRIRELISQGNIQMANELLGHPYTIVGNVVQGKQLGRTIGFPTINIIADPDRIYPPNGVYATKVKVYNHEYMGMTNIGYNPTVNGTRKMIETHILGFDQDLYGQEVKMYFYDYIRHEQKFDSVQVLAKQIERDREQIQQFFTLNERNLQK